MTFLLIYFVGLVLTPLILGRLVRDLFDVKLLRLTICTILWPLVLPFLLVSVLAYLLYQAAGGRL